MLCRCTHGGSVPSVPSAQQRVQHIDLHLFAGLPLRAGSRGATAADGDEEELLLQEGEKSGVPRSAHSRVVMVRQFAMAVAASACACLAVLSLIVVSLSYRRLNAVVGSIDQSVSFTRSASNMIANVDTLLNNSASIARIAHDLGLRGIDASIFSKPFLTKMLNTTDKIFDDAHALLEHPSIKLGG